MKFSLYYRDDDKLIEGLTQFKYLGSILEKTRSDWPAVHLNISKAWVILTETGEYFAAGGGRHLGVKPVLQGGDSGGTAVRVRILHSIRRND